MHTIIFDAHFPLERFYFEKAGTGKNSKISGLAEKQAPCSKRKTPPEMQVSTVTSTSVNSLFIPNRFLENASEHPVQVTAAGLWNFHPPGGLPESVTICYYPVRK